MILVSTGTNGAPFDRLLSVLQGIQGDEEMIVQHGPSSLRPIGATCVAAMPFDEFVAAAERARVLITHAGVGSILVALMTGHKPILVPRLAAHGEAVDDHQLELAERLVELNAASVVTNTPTLASVLHPTSSGVGGSSLRSPLVAELEQYLGSILGEAANAQGRLVASEHAP